MFRFQVVDDLETQLTNLKIVGDCCELLLAFREEMDNLNHPLSYEVWIKAVITGQGKVLTDQNCKLKFIL